MITFILDKNSMYSEITTHLLISQLYFRMYRKIMLS